MRVPNLRVLSRDLVVRPGIGGGAAGGGSPPTTGEKGRENRPEGGQNTTSLLWTVSDIPNLIPVSLTGRNFERRPECVRWFPRQRSRNAGTRGPWQSPFPQGWRRATGQAHQSCSPDKTQGVSKVLASLINKTLFTKFFISLGRRRTSFYTNKCAKML